MKFITIIALAVTVCIALKEVYSGLHQTSRDESLVGEDVFALIDEIKRLRANLAEATKLLEGCSYFDSMATYSNGVYEWGMDEGACHAVSHYDSVNSWLRRIAEVSNDDQ